MVKQFSISIHAPAWGATANTTVLREVIQISIHAPAWGSDRERRHESASNSNFNPRSRTGSDGVSLKRCTNPANFNPRSRMGSDDAEVENQGKSHHFNPRPPHGERLSVRSRPITAFTFQSTLPAWGATDCDRGGARLRGISIHAPRMGSDSQHTTSFAR